MRSVVLTLCIHACLPSTSHRSTTAPVTSPWWPRSTRWRNWGGPNEGPSRAEFWARAEFARLPGAKRGHIEAKVTSPRSVERMAPSWPCRTPAALHSLLDRAILYTNLEYVLALRRGLALGNRGRLDVREVADPDQLEVRYSSEDQEDGIYQTFQEYLAQMAFPPDEGYLCYSITAPDGLRELNPPAWRQAIMGAAANLMIMVGNA
jgi:hypothetical protein